MDLSVFSVPRGVRQGCPLSPYLFIPAVELLANQMRNNQNIKGINVNGVKVFVYIVFEKFGTVKQSQDEF